MSHTVHPGKADGVPCHRNGIRHTVSLRKEVPVRDIDQALLPVLLDEHRVCTFCSFHAPTSSFVLVMAATMLIEDEPGGFQLLDQDSSIHFAFLP